MHNELTLSLSSLYGFLFVLTRVAGAGQTIGSAIRLPQVYAFHCHPVNLHRPGKDSALLLPYWNMLATINREE